MNKQELVAASAVTSGLTKKAMGEALDAITSTISSAMESGEKVTIVGFGTWEVKPRAERNGVNPRTKQAIVIPATKAVKFKAGKDLKECAKV